MALTIQKGFAHAKKHLNCETFGLRAFIIPGRVRNTFAQIPQVVF